MSAPILQDNRTTTTISLPGYEGSEVVVYDNVLLKDMVGMDDLIKKQTPEEMIKVLPRLIKSWNFVDAENKPMAVTSENLGLLSVEAVTLMAETIAEAVKKATEHKKKVTQG